MNILNPTKRELALMLGALAILPNTACASLRDEKYNKAFAALEKSTNGGRLGVFALNMQTGASIGHRINERFAMCSTFKLILAAVILKSIDLGEFHIDDEIPISANGLKPFNETVAEALERGKINIIDACKSIQINSDNIAANALLELVGGPNGLTQKIRDLGDKITRIDRTEPNMNHVSLNDVRDTTTPHAFVDLMSKILIGDYLSPASRGMLKIWMSDTKTGLKRLRAGINSDYWIGDKTGTGIWEGLNNKYNDVALVAPLMKSQFLIASYYEAPNYFDEIRDIDQKVVADTGRIINDWILHQ